MGPRGTPTKGQSLLPLEQRRQDHRRPLLAAGPPVSHRLDPGQLGRGAGVPPAPGPVLHRRTWSPIGWPSTATCSPRCSRLGRVVTPADRFFSAPFPERKRISFRETLSRATGGLWRPRQAGPLAEQQQRIRRDGGVVGDDALADHLLEPGPGHPGLAHVLLFVFPLRRPRLEPGGQEEVAALAGDAVRAVQVPELDQPLGAQPRLLRELQPGELVRLARRPAREPALRERPSPPPDRVAELLDQVEAVVLGRDDQREVGLAMHDEELS